MIPQRFPQNLLDLVLIAISQEFKRSCFHNYRNRLNVCVLAGFFKSAPRGARIKQPSLPAQIWDFAFRPLNASKRKQFNAINAFSLCAAPTRSQKRSPQREVDWRFSFSVSVSQRRRRGSNSSGDAGSSVWFVQRKNGRRPCQKSKFISAKIRTLGLNKA